MQAPARDPMRDRMPAESQSRELMSCDHPMLAIGQLPGTSAAGLKT
jgi:hypothetical protein